MYFAIISFPISDAGLESLPLAPAAPFHQHEHQHFQQQVPKGNLVDGYHLYAPSQCSHGPNLAGAGGINTLYQQQSVPQFQSIPQYQSVPQFQHLQTVYGVPPQSLDVSHASSFEIAAQNAATQGILDSYAHPASGAASSIDQLINTHEEHATSSSYGV